MKKPLEVIAGLCCTGRTFVQSRMPDTFRQSGNSDGLHGGQCIRLAGLTIIIASLALSACAQTPVTVIERVNIPTYIPTPGTLTAPVKVTLQPGVTWGEAVGSLYSGLQTCNAQLSSISTLKPPEKPY